MATKAYYPISEIGAGKPGFSKTRSIIEAAFYGNNVVKINTLREAYELAKNSPGTVVTDMPIKDGETFGLPADAKVLLFNDGAVTGRYAAARRIEPEAVRTLTIPERNIGIVSLPEGFTAELAETEEPYEMIISGLSVSVNAVDQAALTGTVDIGRWMEEQEMEELRAGTYEIPVSIEIPNDVNMEQELIVQINIIELEDEE